MHELSIAQSILDIAQKEMKQAQAEKMQELELEIGTLAGIEFQSLQFALKALTAGTLLEEMRIIIHKPEGKAHCLDCNQSFPVTGLLFSCPTCQGYHCQVIQGKELKVKSIVI